MAYKYRQRQLVGLRSLALFLVILLVLAGSGRLPKGIYESIESHQPDLYSVAHFVDGDTITVNMNGHVEKIRFIGVDTPETHKPNTPVQCYGPDAAAYTRAAIGRQHVRLVSDAFSTDRDRYGRLLRYIYLPDGTNLNAQLIRTGHGFYYPYFPFTKSKEFAADEQSAIHGRQGLWASCHPTPSDNGGYKMEEPA